MMLCMRNLKAPATWSWCSTGNCLRNVSSRPIDILKSGTRRDDLLLSREEAEAVDIIRKATNSLKPEDAVEKILDLFARTRNNREFVENAKRIRFF